MSDPVKPTPPPHLLGAMRHAWEKAVYAQLRLGTGRLRRRVRYVQKATGAIIYVGRSKWRKLHDKWQRRFAQACKRLDPYITWEKVELAP